MQYNYYYEIASVVFMALLLFVLLLQRNFELAKGRAFFLLIVSCVVESIMNIASSWGLAHTDLVSSQVNWLICFVFFLAEACTSILFFHYVVVLCEASRAKRTKYAKGALIPFLLFLFMILTTRPFHLIFDVKDNVYSQGSMAWYGYFYITLFIVASVMVAATAKSTIRGRNRYAVILTSLISAMGIVIQYEYKQTILTGISNALIVYIFYILVQNPNELKDKVSNVSNERAFYLRFENTSNQDQPMCILLVDIHQEVQLNVLFGYRNGNVILGEVGDFLSELTGPKNVFHISTSGFAIVLNSEDKLEHFKKQILTRFEKPWTLEDISTRISVNLEVLRFPDDVKSLNEFYGKATFLKQLIRQDAMHNYIEMTPELRQRYDRTAEVDRALQRALKDESIQVYFQPIYNVKAKKFTALEALARMFDSELGFVAPDEFITAAENNGMIVPLDLMILDKVCRFIEQNLLPLGERSSIETIQVNISVFQCMQPNMDEIILEIIDRHQVPRNMIMLEITERATISAAELMEKHMHNLKEQGVCFALDDYGTGNSNCSYLIDYPFNKVKFDKSMVWAYFNSETGKVLLDGEMRTIHRLNIPIVAEGIEEKEQVEAMEALGVEFIQGYYYSKPLSKEDTIHFLLEAYAKR